MRTPAIPSVMLALLLACTIPIPVRAVIAETPRPRQITVADGLPSNRINGITEDHNGYLWIATSDGLARYDGIGFRIWRVENGLRDNFVWAVHVDARNRVWIGTGQAGLAMLGADRKQFHYFNRSNTPQIGSDTVWSVTSTPDGAIWFGTAFGGLHRLDADGKVTRYMPRPGDPRSLPDAEVGQLVVAPDGSLWAGTKGGGARWTGRDFERLPANALSSPLINGITVESDGTLWFATPRGVGVRHADGRVSATPWADAGMKDPILHVLLRDRSGMYWFDIPQGLGRDQDGKLSVVPLYSGTAQGMVRPGWIGAYEDREGGLWFASSSNGLWYLAANWRQFAVMSRRLDQPASLGNAQVRGVAPSADGAMWLVGSGGVLDRLDPDSGAVTHVVRDVGDGYILSHVLEDRSGTVWVSYAGGIARIDAGTRRLRRWSAEDKNDSAPTGESKLVQTGDGMIWLITEDGVMQVRSPDGRIRESLLAGADIGLDSGVLIEQAGLGPDGALWLACSNGMLRWNSGRHRFEPIPGARQGRVDGFAIDARGQVWLARLGELETYHWAKGTLQRQWHMGTDDGLPLVAVGGLRVDAAGIVWMSSVRGLTRVDPERRAVRVYGVRDGLPSQEFDAAPVVSPRDGKILIGSPEGLVLFDPAMVRPNTQAPHLVIESIDVRRNDQHIMFSPTRAFDIRHDDRDLRIVARLLSFTDARNHAYRFRLVGYDNDWVDVGSVGERIFSQLKPGQYQLQVAARTADNVWSRAQTIAFTVATPWWQTWAAIAVLVGLAALLGGWLADAYRRRLKRRHHWQLAQHERELAKQASLAKTQFLATLGHEVRTPMTGVLGMSELLLDTPLDPRQRGYIESIRRAGRHLLRLVNDALDLARIESGRLELADAPFALHDVVVEAASLMAPLAQQRDLAFCADLDANVPAGLRGDANRVCQILLNLLGNAIKFTDKGTVSLRVSALLPQGVRFEVADTGPGISEEQLVRLFRRFEQAEGARTAARYGGSGLGLAICQELAEAMGGGIRVESTPGEGTRFIVDLPLAEAPVPAADDGSDALLASRGGPLTLLLVEDDPTVAEVISALLRAQGHRVTHAAHGLSALAEAATASFDAALLDLDLPGMDGLALAEHLRAQGFSRPMLAITARADADAEPQATAAGFQGFLRKPVTGAMLAGLLEGVPRRYCA